MFAPAIMTNTPENKIYLTSKTRMTAEARVRSTAATFHYLISWYSFCLIVLTIGQLSNRFDVPFGDLLAVALSIALFALSLFVYGERYHERADQFRDCYLKLQELYTSNITAEEKMSSYARVLEQYENQRSYDYDAMLFDAWIRGQKLQNASGNVSITFLSGSKVVARRIIKFVLFATLFIAPLVIAFEFGEPATQPASIRSQDTKANGV